MGREIRYGLASAIQDGSITGAKIADGTITNADVSATAAIAKVKIAPFGFGGTGADGALTITSGVTTIDLLGAAFVVRNYTSISITGTAQLAFINPNANGTTILLRSQGNVTLTSSTVPNIDASKLGGIGGTAVTNTNGNNGSDGIGVLYKSNFGTGGVVAVPTTPAGAVISQYTTATTPSMTRTKYAWLTPGAGAGSGRSATVVAAGKGGRGGGALCIECGGAWNFTVANGISVAGENGVTPVGAGDVAGGGGGSGGDFLGLYNTLTANTGTVNIAGGVGANNGPSSAGNVQGGGGAGNRTAGTTGNQNPGAGVKTGGDGGQGSSSVVANTEF